MIRYLGEDEKEVIRPLYEEAFDDAGAFVDYYFQSYVKGRSKCLVDEEADKVVSMISIHQKQWRLRNGESCRVWYLYGIATGKAYRRQGRMRRLMERVLADGRRESIAYIYLIPVNPKVYEELGFQLVDKGMTVCPEMQELQSEKSSMWVALAEVEAKQSVSGETGGIDIYEKLVEDYEVFCQACRWDAYIEKDGSYFREQAMRARLEQGDIYLLYEEGKLMAFATAGIHEGTCTVVEFINMETDIQSGRNTEQYKSLSALARFVGARRLQYQRFPVMIYAGTGKEAFPENLGGMDEV